MDKEVLALALTVLVHFVGLGALIWALIVDEDERPDWRGWWPGDEDDDRPPNGPAAGDGGLPLRDALPSAVRLRGPARLADAHPRPGRRPQHAPERAPGRIPAGDGRSP